MALIVLIHVPNSHRWFNRVMAVVIQVLLMEDLTQINQCHLQHRLFSDLFMHQTHQQAVR